LVQLCTVTSCEESVRVCPAIRGRTIHQFGVKPFS
jgi:hypothetical protein